MSRGPGSTSIVVGIDLVQISAITASVASFGGRFLERLFTSDELRYCLVEPPCSGMRLAARFAAKEAVRKVLGDGADGVAWRSIEVVREPRGACSVALHREADARARDAGFSHFSLSMSHEADFATAVVVGERRRTRGT
jgi:holo-[acyl-carrier protein] synthase